MQVQTKTALILLATLILGGLIGALVTSALMNNRVEELQALRRGGTPFFFLERAIEPIDDAQREQIQNILETQEERFRELREYTFEQHRAFIDSTRRALDEVLTDDQKAALREWVENDRLRARRGGRGGPPSPEQMREFRRRFEEGGPPRPGFRRRGFRPDSMAMPPPVDSVSQN